MLNSITLMGRLTAEPDYRTTQSGVPLAKFTLAVERDYSGQSGEKVTDFLDVDAWRQTADFVSKYFHKGQLVAVVGSVQVENYTDRDGNKRRSWTVQAQHCYFAEPKRDGQPQPQNGYNSQQQSYNGQQQRHNVNVAYEQQQPYNGQQQPPQGYQQGGYAQPYPQPYPQQYGQAQPYNAQQQVMNGYAPQPAPYQAAPVQGQAPYNDDDLPF